MKYLDKFQIVETPKNSYAWDCGWPLDLVNPNCRTEDEVVGLVYYPGDKSLPVGVKPGPNFVYGGDYLYAPSIDLDEDFEIATKQLNDICKKMINMNTYKMTENIIFLSEDKQTAKVIMAVQQDRKLL